jgi:ATP-dependent DNA ligase
MAGTMYAFSLPTKADKVPAGSEWLHEIKHDGYRMMLIREQDRVRLISRGGYDSAEAFCARRRGGRARPRWRF